jgi:UDP-N-acetylglucosamine 1-carboxyvinyltransferase
MDRIRIAGGRPLTGNIRISGAKNATLPLMIASLLTDGRLTLENVPDLADVGLLKRILAHHGVDYTVSGRRATDAPRSGETLTLSAENIVDTTAPYDLVSRMRASFWVIGPLLARMHDARVSLPGGCAIGTRPGRLLPDRPPGLGGPYRHRERLCRRQGGRRAARRRVRFPHVSVGATHTVMMAATLARGETVIENAAREPEVRDLADCLTKMGARIDGAGTDTIHIQGVDRLNGAVHPVLPDRIETGTYAMAVAATGGDVLLQGASSQLLQAALDALASAGAEISETHEGYAFAVTVPDLRPSISLPNRFQASRQICRRSSWR